jgi:hypothetical protein
MFNLKLGLVYRAARAATRDAQRSAGQGAPRGEHNSVCCTPQGVWQPGKRATPPARLAPPHRARAAHAGRQFSGSAQGRRVRPASPRNPRVWAETCAPQRAAGARSGPRAFTKPMSLAYSRKHWRHMSSAYLRMSPFWLEHTRLRSGAAARQREPPAPRKACSAGRVRHAERPPGQQRPAVRRASARRPKRSQGESSRRTSCGRPWSGRSGGCSTPRRSPW